jgi:hypothetical protein
MQYCGAGIHIDAAPICKALCCRGKRFIEVCGGRQRQRSERFASGGIYDGVTIAPFALAPAAINIKAQISSVAHRISRKFLVFCM